MLRSVIIITVVVCGYVAVILRMEQGSFLKSNIINGITVINYTAPDSVASASLPCVESF